MSVNNQAEWLFQCRPAEQPDETDAERKAIQREQTRTRSFVALMMEEAAKRPDWHDDPLSAGVGARILERAAEREQQGGQPSDLRRLRGDVSATAGAGDHVLGAGGRDLRVDGLHPEPPPGPTARSVGAAGAPWKGQGQRNPPRQVSAPWEPTHRAEPRPVRRLMWRLRDGLRRYAARSRDPEACQSSTPSKPAERFMPRSFGCCGHVMTGDAVSMRATDDGRVVLKGITTCGLAWECPVCQMTIKARRAEQIAQLVEWHGREGAFLLTLTFRHGRGNDLRTARQGLANAWRGMTRGKPWKLFKERLGVRGTVRAMEVTHGPNGWHPHLHVLFLCRPGWEAATMWDGLPVQTWLADRWASMVIRYLGPEHEPDPRYGTTTTACMDGQYLAKLGLEVSDPGRKEATKTEEGEADDQNRNPLEIARDLVDHGRRSDRELWRVYCQAMHGARQLTWSKGLRAVANIPDKTDAELAADEEAGQQTAHVLTVAGDDWRRIARKRIRVEQADGSAELVPAPVLLIERAEQKGARAAWRMLRSLVHAPDHGARGVRHEPKARTSERAKVEARATPPAEVDRKRVHGAGVVRIVGNR